MGLRTPGGKVTDGGRGVGGGPGGMGRIGYNQPECKTLRLVVDLS